MSEEASDFERLGGHEGLRVLVEDFVGRVFDDFIIGFLFEGRDRARIIEHEIGFAAAHLGGPRAYAGRPMGAVHKPLRINRGHFRRRLALLRTVLTDHGAPTDIIDRWIAHDSRLEPVVTDGTDCAPEAG